MRKKDDDWVKQCTEYEVEGPRPRGRPKRTWREVVREDCLPRKLNTEDVMDCSKWREDDKGCPMIRMCVSGGMFLLVLASPCDPTSTAVKQLCVLSLNSIKHHALPEFCFGIALQCFRYVNSLQKMVLVNINK